MQSRSKGFASWIPDVACGASSVPPYARVLGTEDLPVYAVACSSLRSSPPRAATTTSAYSYLFKSPAPVSPLRVIPHSFCLIFINCSSQSHALALLGSCL